MGVAPATRTALQGKIKKAQENVAEAAARKGPTRQVSLTAAKKKLAQLEFIAENLVVVDKASHTRLDTVIEALKEELVDVDAIVADIKNGKF
jgi:3-hydroxyacyl-CoA dehydrogenase